MPANFSDAFQWPAQLPEIREALIQAFESEQWGKYDGDNCRNLTTKLSEWLGLEHVRLCSSGTIATEIALKSLGVKPGDDVVLAGYDFPGNFRSIENAGAKPVLADIRSGTWSIDFESIRNAATLKTKAIIVSYLHGGLAEIEKIVSWARELGIQVVEDICQCPGATLGSGNKLGTIGDVCVMSFGGSKLLSAGRGGALATRNESIAQRATIYCERGNDAFPLSELQAAVLIPQVDQHEAFARERAKSFQRLRDRLAEVPELDSVDGAYTDFFKVPFRLVNTDHKQAIIDELRSQGILINHGFRGFVGRSSRRCLSPVELTHSRDAAQSTLVLHHPCLLSDSFDEIVAEVIRVVRQFASQS